MSLRDVFSTALILAAAALALSAQGARGGDMVRATLTNAPFSATVTTTLVHPLADGNEIDRTSSYNFYRDSQGRTRREELDKSGQVTEVTIVDPVAGKRYTLHPDKQTAEEYSLASGAGRRGSAFTVVGRAGTANTRLEFMVADGALLRLNVETPGNSATETLAPTTYQGLNVTGKRTTRTIPAGAIGNREPIAIVTEQWYSPELEVYVRTKHSDPQAGTTQRSTPTSNAAIRPRIYSPFPRSTP